MEEPLCPSFTCVEGATLLGIIGPDGGVRYLNPAPTVDRAFVELAGRSRPAEQKFRFAAPCATSACSYWSGARCGIADRAVAAGEQLSDDSAEPLPRCAIRAKCQWFAQRGRDACRVCPAVFNYHPRETDRDEE